MRVTAYLDQLRRMLPTPWALEAERRETQVGSLRADALLRVVAPEGTTGVFTVETKSRVSARDAVAMGERFSQQPRTEGLVLAGFVSKMGRQRLREAGVSYLDQTGNAWIRLPSPAVFIDRQGADTDPNPPRRGVQSLKGTTAARIVRGLCDWSPPFGVRELARLTDADPGYVTRVLKLLEEEDLIERGPRGKVLDVRWRDLLLRWSDDYTVTETNRAATFLAVRGLSSVIELLPELTGPYALTGSLAVPAPARVAPGRLLSFYVSEVERAAADLDLRPADAGANVVLLEPFDDVVFERTRVDDGRVLVALSQCVVDLMTGSGREPAQAEALLTWMKEHEDDWRT